MYIEQSVDKTRPLAEKLPPKSYVEAYTGLRQKKIQ